MLLEIKNLNVQFETDGKILPVVEDLSLALERGQVLGLVGESGCGKTVTAMSIPRLLPMPPARITQGNILFDGVDLLKVPIAELRQLRGAKIGMIFQDPMTSLSPLHRIEKQMTEVVRLHQNISKASARRMALEWLERVGIPDVTQRAQAYPHELSGGMQQRIMIAMGLMLEPDFIIADEPTTALDVTIQAQILLLLRKLHRQQAGLLLITHDMGVVSQMATHVAVMYAGQIVEYTDAQSFFHQPQHPYSRALLDAMPSLATRGQRLKAIPGQVPLAGQMPSGCRFHERCPLAQASCAQIVPELTYCGDSWVRCPIVSHTPINT